MNRLYFVLSLLCHSLISCVAQTSISGIINQYAAVTEIEEDCLTRITVSDTTGFRKGGEVFIIQMQGAEIESGNNNNFGRIRGYRGTGSFERVRIDSLNGLQILFRQRLLNNYDPAIGEVQIVSIPKFSDAIVSDTLRPRPWNGSTGGILILEVENTLELQAPIIASERGFRGGIATSNLPNDCSWINQATRQYYRIDSWRGAMKGEGIALYILDREAGRGPQANGGGGGNDHNSGGGGGGNAHDGGQGGENNEPSTFGCRGRNPGRGGKELLQNADFLFMGGGGGAGHGNNDNGTDGGNGGGMIILLAKTIQANGQFIQSNGGSVLETQGDGAGGGGAAGTIAILADTLNGIPRIELKGGNGGDVNNLGAERCFGPGGGGSPGFLMTHSNIRVTDYDLRSEGGKAGRTYNSRSCNSGNNGAEDATDMARLLRRNELPLSDIDLLPTIASAPDSIKVCVGDSESWEIDASGFGLTYLWQWNRTGNWEDLPTDPNHQISANRLQVQQVQLAMNSYSYRLIVTDQCGQSLISTPTILSVSPQPLAGFTLTQNDLEINITNNSSEAISYRWNFGDGNNSTATNPVHTYTNGGQYTVELIAVNNCGEDTLTQVINVVQPQAPTAGFIATPLTGCAPLVVQFTDQSLGTITSRLWEFPGGTPSTSTETNPIITYNTAGVFNATLTASNAVGSDQSQQLSYIIVEDKPTAGFTFNINGGDIAFNNISQNAGTYQWNFGDGNTSTMTTPTHTYATDGQYTIQLIASNACGSDTTTQIVDINRQQAPSARFSATPLSGCSPLEVQFTDLSSGTIENRVWEFPGGIPATSTEATPLVRYSTAGDYDVRLSVSNSVGNDESQQTAYIQVESKPVADFNFSINGRDVTLDNTSQNATNYSWDFDDGNTSTLASPDHNYASGGSYNVRLIASNTCGADTIIQVVHVTSLSAPTVSFSSEGNQGCAPYNVTFMDNSGPNIQQRTWRFDGGNPAISDERNPTVTYDTPGSYPVQLEVVNAAGSDDILEIDYINVFAQPRANFSYEVRGDTVFLTNLSTDGLEFRWSFGDGTISNAVETFHVYERGGLYRITLAARNGVCNSVISIEVPIIISSTNNPDGSAKPIIFPNPAHEQLWIQWPKTDHPTQSCRIFSPTGILVYERLNRTNPIENINLSQIPSGLYLLEMRVGELVWWEKIVIE